MVDATISRRQRQGFTVAEILLALALISVVVLTLIGLSLYSLNANRKSRDVSAGQLVAEQVLERLVYEADTSPASPIWAQNSQSVAYAEQQVTVEPSVFNVTTYVSNVNDQAGTIFVAGRRLKRLEALVVWQDAQAGKSGYGRLSVRATRLVNEP
ncbi:hypothetical protein IV102_06340 [bacterium]|nr:hypothetical protein [bacterium]